MASSEKMTLRSVKVADLVPNPDNPRVNSSAVSAVVASIQRFGFRVPLVIDSDNNILAGHTRYRAALSLGLTEVPCVDASDLSDEEKTAFMIADNRASDFAFFDIGKLGDLVQAVPEELLEGFDIDSLLGPESQEDSEEHNQVKPEKRDGLDLAPFERYQYVMVLCRTEFDYVNLLDMLKLENVQKRYVRGVMKRGVSYGRVIEYPDFMERLNER